MSRFNFDQVTLIDDDVVVKILMVKILRNIGFDGLIHQFEDGKKAMEEIQKIGNNLPPNGKNLILLDINMPEMDGWEFLKGFSKFSKNWKDNQYITMISSSIDNLDKQKAFKNSDVKDFIQKPVSIQLLKDFLISHKLMEL